MNTYQQILIMFDNFEIIFIGALFPPETAVSSVMSVSINVLRKKNRNLKEETDVKLKTEET